jgi:hypothetical protein
VAKADLRVDEWPHPSGVATFWLLRHADTDPAGAASFDPGADLGSGANADVLASIVQQDSILYGMKTRRPLPPSVAARLVRAAAETAAEAPEDKKLTALVALPRLCAWARAGERWNDAEVLSKSNGEACEAAEAIALGRPREGHSVLGRGTFAAAEPAWVALAEAHMEEDADVLGELMAYKSVLPGAFRAAHMADGDPEYLAVAGGGDGGLDTAVGATRRARRSRRRGDGARVTNETESCFILWCRPNAPDLPTRRTLPKSRTPRHAR